MTTPLAREGFEAAGINSILPKEHGAKFFVLPVVRSDDVSDAVRACVVSWDSSIHDSLHLNRVTPTNERVYLIVKVRRCDVTTSCFQSCSRMTSLAGGCAPYSPCSDGGGVEEAHLHKRLQATEFD